jgi:PTH1 family peptidyl-tRNA hydrolase
MKLIVFLGNPGIKYRKTRHNLGFMAGDFLAKQWGAKWNYQKKFAAEIAEVNSTESVLLAKPQKFYNLSGETVSSLVKFYKLKLGDLLVVCDDFNLPFGTIRQREKGSDGGNNGLKSIVSMLGTDQFTRLRVGTDGELRSKLGDTDFVLSKFNRQEQQQLPEIFTQISQKIDQFVRL